MSQFEKNMEKSIENTLNNRISSLSTKDTILLDSEEGTIETEKSIPIPSYAKKVLEVPKEIRKIMEDARNDEKVEEIERQRRPRNFIIHGAEEIGESATEIKTNDEQYIIDILKHLNIKHKPVSVTRLGPPNAEEMRVPKIIMKGKEERDDVITNLRKLKGTEITFSKISITHRRFYKF